MVYRCNPTNQWKEALPIAKAVKGSSFAVVRSPDSDVNKIVSRIYYQDLELCLREHCYNHSDTMDQWVPGELYREFAGLYLLITENTSHFR